MLRALVVAASVAASACSTLSDTQPLPELASQSPGFEMAARLSVRQGERGDLAKLRWTHHRASDLWILASPLGSEVAHIEADARGATLHRPGEPAVRAASFSALTETVLGAALDPAELALWLHGAESAPTTSTRWRVVIEETQRAGALVLARRITATSGDTVVKLVVDSYLPLED